MIHKLNLKAVFVFIFFFILGCAELQQMKGQLPKPEVTLDKVEVTKISLKDVTLHFYTKVKNPYPAALKLDGVNLDFSIENTSLLKTTAAKGIQIPAGKKADADFEVVLNYIDVARIVKDIQNKDLITCNIKAVVAVPLPKLTGLPPSINFTFQLTQKIPALSPGVRVENFAVAVPSVLEIEKKIATTAKNSYSAKDIYGIFDSVITGNKPQVIPEVVKEMDLKFDVSFDVILENKTKFPLNFKAVNYGFSVNNENLVSGETNNIVKKGNTSVLKITNSFSSKNLSSAVVQAFKTGKGSFQLKGASSISLPKEVSSSDVNLDFAESGQFNLRKQ